MSTIIKVALSVLLGFSVVSWFCWESGVHYLHPLTTAQYFRFEAKSPNPASERVQPLNALRGPAFPPSEDEILGTNGEVASERQADRVRIKQEKQAKLQQASDYVRKQVAELKEAFEEVDGLPEMSAFLGSAQALNSLEVDFKNEWSSSDDTPLKAGKLRGIVQRYAYYLQSHRMVFEALLFALKGHSSQYIDSLDLIERLESNINGHKPDVSSADLTVLLAPIAKWEVPYSDSQKLYFDVFKKFDDALKQKRIDDNGDARYQLMLKLTLAWLERDVLVSDE